jgi:hypothetical protein
MNLKLELKGVVFEVVLTAEFSPHTAAKLIEALPFELGVMTSGAMSSTLKSPW